MAAGGPPPRRFCTRCVVRATLRRLTPCDKVNLQRAVVAPNDCDTAIVPDEANVQSIHMISGG
jgi:hypothetical protein